MTRAQAIAEGSRKLNQQREAWLNPPELVKRQPEVVEGYPDRIVPVDEKAEKELKTRTLTKLYNERPTWLDNAHRELDRVVAAAYCWPEDISDKGCASAAHEAQRAAPPRSAGFGGWVSRRVKIRSSRARKPTLRPGRQPNASPTCATPAVRSRRSLLQQRVSAPSQRPAAP